MKYLVFNMLFALIFIISFPVVAMDNEASANHMYSALLKEKSVNALLKRSNSMPAFQSSSTSSEPFIAVVEPIPITSYTQSDEKSSESTIIHLANSLSRSSISMLDEILNPSVLSSRRNIKSFECIQVIGSRAFVHAAAATILADKLGYFEWHTYAASALPVAVVTGVVNGFYDCGEKIENERVKVSY
ncbi:hypothetical protein [Endozoicomonas sp. Mp262]|uniref:hypothetical protein n=1 Tax=Endozoicomonas sp. Mp262 TaxID=2919499 RepID=UPI0021D9E1C1